MSNTATRSSTTSTPNTSLAWGASLEPVSLKALMMMVVDDIQSMPPRNSPFKVDQPINCPINKPADIIPATMTMVVTNAVLPTSSNFLKLKSSPNAKRRMITPMSAQVWILAVSRTSTGNRPRLGPASTPARTYPNTSGCFNHLNKSVMTPAALKINARSMIKDGKWDIGRCQGGWSTVQTYDILTFLTNNLLYLSNRFRPIVSAVRIIYRCY